MSSGFVQIPILIAMVISAAIFGGGGYFVAKQATQDSKVIATTEEEIKSSIPNELSKENEERAIEEDETNKASSEGDVATDKMTSVQIQQVEKNTQKIVEGQKQLEQEQILEEQTRTLELQRQLEIQRALEEQAQELESQRQLEVKRVLEKEQEELERINDINKGIQDLLSEYDEQIAAIDEQILEIKQNYYEEEAKIRDRPIAMSIINARIQNLVQETNTKIDQLYLKQEELRLEYQGKIRKLENQL